jgi:hypothetical protein
LDHDDWFLPVLRRRDNQKISFIPERGRFSENQGQSYQNRLEVEKCEKAIGPKSTLNGFWIPFINPINL